MYSSFPRALFSNRIFFTKTFYLNSQKTCSLATGRHMFLGDDRNQIRSFSCTGPKAQLPSNFNLNINFKQISAQISDNTKEIFKNYKASDLKDAPQPALILGAAGLIPFVFPPLSFIILEYSEFLATAQLFYGATICAFLGGVKWGHSVDTQSVQRPTWENLGLAVAPQLVAWTGLLLPQTLGFLTVSAGLSAAAYIDLTSGSYPRWFKALRLSLTVPAVVSLLLSAFLGIVE